MHWINIPTNPAIAPTMLATVLIVLEKLGDTSRKAQPNPDVTKPKKPRATFMNTKATKGVCMKPDMIRDPPRETSADQISRYKAEQ